jgi:general secretion pathway protein C
VSATAWFEELRTGPGWTRLLEQHGAQLLVLALLIALALDSALILTRALNHRATTPSGATTMPNTAGRSAVNPAVELAAIVNAHLFGRAGVANSENAPPTTMPLILAGVIAGPDPSRGQAIIGPSATSAKLYAVGAAIPGGARLHAVYSDRVLLERNGGLETLKLPHTATASIGANRTASAQLAPRTEAQRDNSSVLAGLVRIQPVFNQGKLSGYRIFPGGTKGNNAFNQLGLKSGDLIQAVNGTPLDDAGRAMEVLGTLSSSSSATVTVSRNGQAQEVNLNLANLNVDAESNPSENAAPGAPPGDATPAASAPSAPNGPAPGSGRGRPPVSNPLIPAPGGGGASDVPAAPDGAPGAAGAIGEQVR